MRDLALRAVACFEATARLGSATAAAEELGVSPSAVSHQLRLLEGQLGVRLFRRERRRLLLTLEGERFFRTVAFALAAIRQARSDLAGTRPTRGVSVRVSPSFGVRWLGPRIAAFAAAHPEWSIRVDATPETSDFAVEAVDVDIRYGFGDWPGLAAEEVVHDLVLPLASPAFAAELADIPDPAARLRAARRIDSVKAFCRWDVWAALHGIPLDSGPCPFRFDRSSMSIELARAHGGIVLESLALCLPEVLAGELVPVTPELPVVDIAAYWLVCPPRHLHRRAVEAFRAWLLAEGRRHEETARAWLGGRGLRVLPVAGHDLVRARAKPGGHSSAAALRRQ